MSVKLINANAFSSKYDLESLYIGLLRSMKPELAAEFVEPYLENQQEAYDEGELDHEPCLDLAIDQAADNAHDKSEEDVLEDVNDILLSLATEDIAAVALCDDCILSGNAASEPDFAFRRASAGERCGAADCDTIVSVAIAICLNCVRDAPEAANDARRPEVGERCCKCDSVEGCANCAPDGAVGRCPRCFDATGNGCGHGVICDDCVASEGDAS